MKSGVKLKKFMIFEAPMMENMIAIFFNAKMEAEGSFKTLVHLPFATPFSALSQLVTLGQANFWRMGESSNQYKSTMNLTV